MLKRDRLFFYFIIITFFASWFSIGFHHVDEHFQVLEMGAYKAGWVPLQDLPWEFSSAIRSSVQPFIVFLLIRMLAIFNIENPFLVALLLRMITAALCITCYNLWRNRLRGSVEAAPFLRWYDAALLFWFIPYLSVRFSSETWSGAIFFISLAKIYEKDQPAAKNFLLAGSLAALAFFFRFQIGFLIAGSIIFRVFNLKKNFVNLIWYGMGFIMVMGACVYLDYLFYDKWCFTPWNYFQENIINARAASFGTEPFFYYLLQVIQRALPLQGLAILAAFSIYVAKKFRDEISISVLFFLAGHFITGHKEMRFLFPLIFILPFVFSCAARWISGLEITRTKFFTILVMVTVITNFILLIPISLIPADPQVALQRVIYRAVQDGNTFVFYERENPFERLDLKMNFYKNRNMRLLPAALMPRYSGDDWKRSSIVVTSINASAPLKDEKEFQCIYQNIPQWVLRFNVNNWVSRTEVFRIYKMKAGSD